MSTPSGCSAKVAGTEDGWRKFELITSGHIGLALQALRKKEKIEKKKKTFHRTPEFNSNS